MAEVRAILPGDVEAVLGLWRPACVESHPFLAAAFIDKSEARFRNSLLEYQTLVLEDGAVRAFLSRAGNFIDALFVDRDFQGRGFGKALLDHAKSQADYLELSAFSLNPRAVAFYQREGFWATTVKIHRETGESIVMLRWERFGPATTMHRDEVRTDVELAHRLVGAQFPQWAALPLATVPSAGTDNALYRLGDDLVVRLPRIASAADQVAKEQRWLPELAPHLPLAIPVPLAHGVPGEGYPWDWSVYRWLPGEPATIERLANPSQAAEQLAQFIQALQRIDATGAPGPGLHNSFRGGPLRERDAEVREAVAALDGHIDTEAVLAAWDRARDAPEWNGKPTWIHGDLLAGNLLAVDGRLSAVIDFGLLGAGDPACDLMVAWTLLPPEAREVFRRAMAPDDAAWARGRGWALSFALIALPYYVETNPVLADIARRTIEAVLEGQAGAV